MVFLRQALFYIKKNFFYLSAFAIVPSVLYALNNTSLNVLMFFRNMRLGSGGIKFTVAYKSFSMINYASLPLSLLAVIFTAVFVALITAFIEKHMRIGKRTFSGLTSKLNDNVMAVSLLLIIFLAIYEIWAVIVSALIVMCSLIITAKTALFILSVAVASIFYVMLFALIALFAVWLPCILITGFNMSDAFVYSAGLMSDCKKDVIISFALPYAAGILIGVAAQVSLGEKAAFVVAVLSFLVYFIYYTSLMFVTYFSLSNEPREDLRKKYF